MADSTHLLKLKAVLDTTDVKNQLNQLRQAQKQAVGQTNSRMEGPSGNLGNLTSVLTRLNSTLMQMQRVLTQLATRQTIQSQVQNSGPNVALTAGGGITAPQRFVDRRVSGIFQRPGFNMAGLRDLMTRPSPSATDLYVRGILNRASGNMPFSILESNWRMQPEFRKAFVNELTGQNDKAARNMAMKPFMGLAFHQGMATAAQGAELFGYKGAAQGFNAVGKIGSYAMMGSMAGAPGMALGGALGAIDSLFSYFTKKAEEAQAKMAEWGRGVQYGLKWRESLGEYNTDRKNAQILRDAVKESRRTPGLLEYEANTRKQLAEQEKLIAQYEMSPYGIKQEELDKALDKYKKLQAQLDQIDNTIESINQHNIMVNQQLEEQRKRAAEQRKREEEIKKAKAEAFRAQKEQVSDAIYDLEMTSANGQLRAQLASGTMSNAEIRKRYKEAVSNQKKYYSEYYTSLGLAKYANTPEETKKWFDAANREKAMAESFGPQREMLGNEMLNRLQEKLNRLVRPDMSNVNSLAGSGFIISKRDDEIRLRSQVDYQKEQTELQRQIKNLTQKILEEAGVIYQ